MATSTRAAPFWSGFRRIVPLWLGIIPFGLAYAVTARSAGLSLWETQLMSLIVFSGGAQFSAAGLFAVNASAFTVVLTTFLINARHFLYGLTLAPTMPLTRVQKLVGAHFLTDEAFGVTVAAGERRFRALFGAELSVFVVWNLSTLAGSGLSDAVPDPAALGVDFVFPLAFLALLIPLLERRTDLSVALLSGALALLASRLVNDGLSVLIAGVLGALIGAGLSAPADPAARNGTPR